MFELMLWSYPKAKDVGGVSRLALKSAEGKSVVAGFNLIGEPQKFTKGCELDKFISVAEKNDLSIDTWKGIHFMDAKGNPVFPKDSEHRDADGHLPAEKARQVLAKMKKPFFSIVKARRNIQFQVSTNPDIVRKRDGSATSNLDFGDLF